MTEELYGAFFKAIIGQLIGGELLFPEHVEAVEAMDDEQWYPWEDYVRMVGDVAGKLRPATMVHVGAGLMRASKDLFVGQGFANADDIFARWADLLVVNIRGIPPERIAVVVEFAPGRLVIDYSDEQPPPLCEGYLRGAASIFGEIVTSLSSEPVERDGRPYTRFSLTWAGARR